MLQWGVGKLSRAPSLSLWKNRPFSPILVKKEGGVTMERYSWRDGRIRLRLSETDLSKLGLSLEAIRRFDRDAQACLRDFLWTLQKRGDAPKGEIIVEVFPGRRGAVLQIAKRAEKQVYYLPRTDDMLTAFPLIREMGAALFRRRDGKGYYVVHPDEKKSLALGEFALPCSVTEGVLRESCKRIL